ncbi:substrate-binding domain-containing protein [Algibacter lectus]|uniref:substrate-binding domain-containing protein n=1 Tax=Algibacter lectus TaxID=221126 RepID=UPI0021CDAE05|nr:substrate-binding domain-containing protein [Algibacter lectus]
MALNTAINLGLKVPKEFSVIAFASKSDSNHTIPPKLTTIRQHAKEIGVSAAQMLIARMQNLPASADVKTKIVKTSIVKNKSTL